MLPLLCSMSLISPNFDVKSIIPILARGLFQKLLEKALNPVKLNELAYSYQKHESITNLGVLSGIFHFFPIFHRTTCAYVYIQPKNFDVRFQISIKVRKLAKLRNRYNQAPHLTKDITLGSHKNTIKHHKREPIDQLFPSRRPQGSNEQTQKKNKHKT